MKIKKSFGLKLYLLFTVSLIFPVLLIFGIFTFYYNNESFENNQRYVTNTLNSMSKNIEISFNELEQVSFTPYLYKDVLGYMIYLKNYEWNYRPDFLKINQLENVYNITFTKLMHSSTNKILDISFYPMSENDNYAYKLSRSTPGLKRVYATGYFKDKLFSSAVKENGEPIYTNFKIDKSSYNSKEYFSLVRMIKDFDSKKVIGVLRIDTSTENIKNVIDQVIIPKNSRVLLFNNKNELIYSSGKVNTSIIDKLNSNNNIVETNDDTYIVTRKNINSSGWKLLYLSSKNDITISNLEAYYTAFCIIFLAALISFFIYYRSSSKMVASVTNILQTIKKIQNGDLSARAEVKENDSELAMISDAINEMSKKLNDHIINEYKAVICQRNAEYLALQSQINPHFFYNTLNGFIALNRMGERNTLEKAIIQLTCLFRYTCNNESISTVKKEFDFLSRYLELQKLRFDDRLNFNINIEPEASEINIPKLLIQPIVENCIVHGMEPSDKPIHINVNADIYPSENLKYLRILIIDDGLGFDPQKNKPKSSGVGLLNISERIKLFNSDAKFEIISSPDKGTKCKIIFPLNHKEE